MIELDISFEEQPWEDYLSSVPAGGAVSAGKFLTLLEGEDEQTVEDALNAVEDRGLLLEVEDLPKTLGSGEAAVRLRMERELAQCALDPEKLGPEDPLRIYLEEVARIPAHGDEILLSEEAARGSEDATAQLVNLGLSRVIELAREYTGYGILLLDLIQEGSLGLLQAIGREHGTNYPAFRDRAIHGAIARAVLMQARANGVGQKLRTAMEDYHQVDERLLGELGRNPTLEEIAEQLHMGVEEASAVQKMVSDARLLARMTPGEQPEREEDDQAVEDTALFQSRARVLDLLSGLNELESQVLTLRFGLEGGKPLSVAQTAARLGMTESEAAAAEEAALTRLREKV